MASHRIKAGKNRFLILLVIFTICILVGMYFINVIILSIRTAELEISLRYMNREASQVDHIGMVSKFKLYLELYREIIDEKEFDREELQTIYLATSFTVQNKTSMTKYRDVSKPVMWIMNVIRLMLGKPAIQLDSRNQTDNELTLAYYFERNNYFHKALKIYNDALELKKVIENKVPVVLLHQGFCNGIVREYNKAKMIFISIIKTYHDENVVTTAALLLQYLEIFLSEIEKINGSNEDAGIKAKKLYSLMAYDEALAILKNSNTDNEKQTEERAYLEARCYEEKGDKKEAVKRYQDIIQKNSASDTARDANRRLLILSAVDDQGNQLDSLARKNNDLIKDNEFNDFLELSEKIKKNKQQMSDEEKKMLAGEMERDDQINPLGDPEIKDYIDASILAVDEKIKQEEIEKTVTPIPAVVPEISTAAPLTVVVTSPTIRPTQPPAQPTRVPEVKPTMVPTLEPVTTSGPTEKAGDSNMVKYTDEKGNIYKVEILDENGNLDMTIYYEYDYAGNPTKIKVYDKNGNLMEK